MKRKCRIWWPIEVASIRESHDSSSSSLLLFGWFISCTSNSFDVVVACVSSKLAFSSSQSVTLQEILREANEKMPHFLRETSEFSLLGQCDVYIDEFVVGCEEDRRRKGGDVDSELNGNGMVEGRNCEKRCVSCPYGELVEQSNWIQMVFDYRENHGNGNYWISKLHHVHWKGELILQCDVHVVLYDAPVYGKHYFTLNCLDSSEQAKAPIKKPNWINELNKRQPFVDLDTVILSINSAAAAKRVLQWHIHSGRSSATYSFYMCHAFLCQVLAMSLASISSVFYLALQLFRSFSNIWSKTHIYNTSARAFSTTWTSLRVRFCQILYWPVLLQENGLRSKSCVEYSERSAILRHSMWLSLCVDVLLGNLIGLLLLLYAEYVCSWVFTSANVITNELLRSGCVWLMGVPAGFKLNTELAEVFGMIALNAIQIWSTLFLFAGFLFVYFIKGLGLLGMVFGLTVPAALTIDLISLASLHVSTLHWAISHIYSYQILALAALWRLFRGRKRNPLRQRLDSYEYTVKQHIVGSLFFTPLLLLLPTTSVFYIFFTILKTSITFVCILIEVTISMIHETPYIKIFLWLVQPRRFPSGIWFEIVSSQSTASEGKQYHVLVSVLRSNYLTIGQLVKTHYKKVFSGIPAFVTSMAYGALTGERITSNLGSTVPTILPWISIPAQEYWRLCYDSVLTAT